MRASIVCGVIAALCVGVVQAGSPSLNAYSYDGNNYADARRNLAYYAYPYPLLRLDSPHDMSSDKKTAKTAKGNKATARASKDTRGKHDDSGSMFRERQNEIEKDSGEEESSLMFIEAITFETQGPNGVVACLEEDIDDCDNGKYRGLRRSLMKSNPVHQDMSSKKKASKNAGRNKATARSSKDTRGKDSESGKGKSSVVLLETTSFVTGGPTSTTLCRTESGEIWECTNTINFRGLRRSLMESDAVEDTSSKKKATKKGGEKKVAKKPSKNKTKARASKKTSGGDNDSDEVESVAAEDDTATGMLLPVESVSLEIVGGNGGLTNCYDWDCDFGGNML